jgi:hypothetical protein
MARESSKQLVRRVVVCIIHTMRNTDLIRELKEAGWVLKRVRGSQESADCE